MQVAITVFCLPIGAGISLEMIRDYRERSAFSSERFLTFRAELDDDGTPSGGPGSEAYANRREAVLNDLRGRLEREPEIRKVTFADGLPGSSPQLRRLEVQRGRETPTPIRGNLDGWVAVSSVGEGFFATFDVPLLAGRGFDPLDREAHPEVVIINESFADKLGGNPLGVRVRASAQGDGEPGPWKEIVGVVHNLGMEPTDRGEADFMFRPATPADVFPPEFALDVPGGPEAFTPRLTAIAREIDPGLRLHDVIPLDELIRRRALPTVLISVGATGVVFVALLLAAAGLFAITAVAVARRTREVGIRLALGASRRSVLRSLFGRAAAQVAAGIAIGSFLLLGAGFLTADDPSIGDTFSWAVGPLLAISGTMIFVAFTASAIPARRALRIQPSDALREDVVGSS
jgi:hypothetical protein